MNTFDLDEYKEHTVSEAVCLKCLKRWIAVRPTDALLQGLECPKCHEIGFVIETGEVVDFTVAEQQETEECYES